MIANPSDKQLAIFSWFAKDPSDRLPARAWEASAEARQHRNLVVRARAGTGKTTTILDAITYAPEDRILLCAFNSDIAAELKKRNGNPHAEAKTLHGVGYALVQQFLGRVRVDKDRVRQRFLTDAGLAVLWAEHRKRLPFELVRLVTKLHEKGRELVPLATGPADLLDVAYNFECEPDDKWARAGFTVDLIAKAAYAAMEAALDENRIKATGIDFADMIYLPVRQQWMASLYDLVVVDETQDMNFAQLLLAQGVLDPDNGRMAIVGDDRQAIYGFRGADSGAIDRLKTELQAGELSLNTTYRCGKRIASFAASIVPDFLSGAGHEGDVTTIYGAHELVKQAENGDYVLSRKRAPLASVAMAFWRVQKRAYIRGRDEGAALVNLVTKLADKADSMPEFLRKLETWKEKEISRALAQGKEERIEGIADKAATIEVIADGVVGVQELLARINKLFEDDGTGDAGRITCSTIHKAKGLEADRVFVLKDTLFLSFKKMRESQKQEEANLAYVAYTRARKTLVLVATEGVAPPPPPVPVSVPEPASLPAEPVGVSTDAKDQ